jgi:hypothetical protein
MILGKEPAGIEWNAWEAFFAAGFPGQKMAFLPKGTPKEIVAAYETAMKKVFADPDFRKGARAELGEYPQYTGEAARETMKRAITIADAERNWVRNWLAQRFKVKLD